MHNVRQTCEKAKMERMTKTSLKQDIYEVAEFMRKKTNKFYNWDNREAKFVLILKISIGNINEISLEYSIILLENLLKANNN